MVAKSIVIVLVALSGQSVPIPKHGSECGIGMDCPDFSNKTNYNLWIELNYTLAILDHPVVFLITLLQWIFYEIKETV